jgi:hypothetical protein
VIITVELTPDEERLLAAVAGEAGSTPTEWARLVVAERLAAAGRPQAGQSPWPPRFFGIGTSKGGERDMGRNTDAYLAASRLRQSR